MTDPRSEYTPMAARDYTAQRQMTVGDLLLDNRIIFLDGPIHDGSANLIVMKMLYLQSENRHQANLAVDHGFLSGVIFLSIWARSFVNGDFSATMQA